MTRDDAITRAETYAIRDIPQSCACGDWQYQLGPARWVLLHPRRGCPWHLSRETRGPAASRCPSTGTPSIATCPQCGGDLEPDGINDFWCPADQVTFSFTQVIPIDETDYDRD